MLKGATSYHFKTASCCVDATIEGASAIQQALPEDIAALIDSSSGAATTREERDSTNIKRSPQSICMC
jgi:hypothetical protein